MVDRLSSAESDFLYLEDRSATTHVGQVMIFRRPPGFAAGAVVEAIAARVAVTARYHRRVRMVPGTLGGPVWVDDDTFDLDYHVRRAALPAPGGRAELADFVARVCARPLDRARPLWECYVVEGLEEDSFAVVTKIHQALADAVGTADITGLSDDPDRRAAVGAPPEAEPAPSLAGLVADAVAEAVRRPSSLLHTVRGGLRDLRATATGVTRTVSTLVRVVGRPRGDHAFAIASTPARRYAMADLDLERFRQIRTTQQAGGHPAPSVHAIALTVLTGAIRIWLASRGEHVRPDRGIRALVPVAVHDEAALRGSRVEALVVSLPVGEGSPLVRLHQVGFAIENELRTRRSVRADELAALSGFAPPALHLLGIRVGTSLSQRLYDVVVTNVPGPQRPLYADGVELLATYPVLPLADGHALAVGITSYRGRVHVGLVADRDAVADLDVLAAAIPEALTELAEWIEEKSA